MSITVNYMGILAEKAGTSKETFNLEGSKIKVVENILDRHPDLRILSFIVSHNGVIQHGETNVLSGDELTLIPPPPGG